MVVPRGWTLDDRREPQPRLFRPSADVTGAIPRSGRRRAGTASAKRQRVEQLELPADECQADVPTGSFDDVVTDPEPEADRAAAPWMPDFDADDDLDGLLHVDSPLLARAFRGTDRTR
jgi:hypothetical protein